MFRRIRYPQFHTFLGLIKCKQLRSSLSKINPKGSVHTTHLCKITSLVQTNVYKNFQKEIDYNKMANLEEGVLQYTEGINVLDAHPYKKYSTRLICRAYDNGEASDIFPANFGIDQLNQI